MRQRRTGLVRQTIVAAGLGSLAILFQGVFIEALAAVEKDIPDPNITAAVEANLLTDKSVPSRLINVQTHDGIVTLSGSVDNILAKEQATKVAETIKGVRAIVNEIVVTPSARFDKALHNDVLIALAQDPATESYDLTVTVNDGVATLEGTVQSWQEKELAGYVTKGVRGIKDVNNTIAIEYQTERPDSEIEADVKRRLAITPWVETS